MWRIIPVLCFVLGGLACKDGLRDVGPRSPGAEQDAPLRASPPPAVAPAGEKLYQVLYAGELGDRVAPMAQRARMLAWIRSLELTRLQLQSLRGLQYTHQRVLRSQERKQSEHAQRELEELEEPYRELVALLSSEPPYPDQELEALAQRLEGARERAGIDQAREDRYRAFHGQLGPIQQWVEKLSPAQQQRMGHSLFFLRRRLGPMSNPGDYGEIVGLAWEGGDFASLHRAVRPADEGHLDLGGLWRLTDGKGDPIAELQGLRLTAILVMALEEPELAGAIEVALGEREPFDFAVYDLSGKVVEP
jgi:hypothetical protein